MVAFLSAAWIEALAEAAAHAPAPDIAETIVVQVVVDPDGSAAHGSVSWHLVASPEGLMVRAGIDDRAIVTLTADVETAAELAQGHANAQRALDLGRLRLRGDLGDLARARAALDALGDVFASVRAGTDFSVATGPTT